MANLRVLILILALNFFTNGMCKIVLPHKLRYLENMLNAEVMAKAAKIRQRIEENPNLQESESWPLLLAKFQENKRNSVPPYAYDNLYNRRLPNF